MVTNPPLMEGFKPFGLAITDLEPVILLFEEYEAIRLMDYLGRTQLEAAREMGVSRPTLTRIYQKARQSIARSFIEGKAIFIEGGDYHTDEFWYRCGSCHKLLISENQIAFCGYCQSDKIKVMSEKTPAMNRQSARENSPGFCICLHCNDKVPHRPGIPCRESKCPRCGRKMVRENSYHHQLYLKKKGENHEDRNTQ